MVTDGKVVTDPYSPACSRGPSALSHSQWEVSSISLRLGPVSTSFRKRVHGKWASSLAKSRSKHLGSMGRACRQDTDVSFPSEMGRDSWVPTDRTLANTPAPHSPTPHRRAALGPILLSDQAMAPSLVCVLLPCVARPISPPEAPAPTPPPGSAGLERRCLPAGPGQTHQRDYKSQQTLGSGLGGGAISASELGGSSGAQARECVWPWHGGSRCVPMGAGRSSPAPGQSQVPRATVEAGVLPSSGR